MSKPSFSICSPLLGTEIALDHPAQPFLRQVLGLDRGGDAQNALEGGGEDDVEPVEIALVLDQERAREAIEFVDRHLSEIAFERPHEVEIFARRRRHVRLTQIGEKLEEHGRDPSARRSRACNAARAFPCAGCRLMSVVVERRGFSLPLGVSPEAEIFAVGDIHGRSDLLAALIDEAAREPKLRDKRAIVFLGDLVDRGPDSLGAIDLAIGAESARRRR